jgi:SAM-dependent methyltransferase
VSKKVAGSLPKFKCVDRSYHGYSDAPYILPNDEEELERLQDIHYCMRRLLGKNVVVPISNDPELIGNLINTIKMLIIVDIGTGSGLWVIDVADEYPNAQVIGTDISPTQPTENIPINCEFRLESCLEGLDFDDESVDLLHSRWTCYIQSLLTIRWLVLAIPTNYWQFYLSEVYRVLKPGTGWVQMLELDRGGIGRPHSLNNSIPKDSVIHKVLSGRIYL